MTTAFVLGGGGLLGAHEVGMLRALAEAGIRPDLVVGTSVGAINGVFVAADPSGAAARLDRMWQGDELRLAFSERIWGRAARLVRSGTHLHSLEPLRRMLHDALPGRDFADLALPFQCVAASIETASARWFGTGPVVPAVLASCAVPGLLPPVEIGGTHYFDGGLVDSIPVGRAIALGASTVYVLQVGRIESPLAVPTRPWEVGLVAFEIARRHRFHEEMSSLPSDVSVHILPTGGDALPSGLSQFRYRDRAKVKQSIERAHTASASYLAALARHLSGLLRREGPIAPTQAGPPARAGTDGDRHRPRGHPAVAVAGRARAAVRAGRAVASGPDAQPPAAVVRGGLAHRRDRGAVHPAGPVDHQQVRRPAAHRALSEPSLRGHPALP
jgi:NTE family protein